MKNQKVKCTKCKWQGNETELKKVKNEQASNETGLTCVDDVCPKCGNNEHYLIN